MLHNGNYMNEIIENIAVQAGFIKDKYGLFWDNDNNAEGVDLERFAELIVLECVNKQLALAAIFASIPGYEPVSSEFLDGTINGLKEGAELIKQHFGVSK